MRRRIILPFPSFSCCSFAKLLQYVASLAVSIHCSFVIAASVISDLMESYRVVFVDVFGRRIQMPFAQTAATVTLVYDCRA
jgi:nucleoside recognition membrane protein YjiH